MSYIEDARCLKVKVVPVYVMLLTLVSSVGVKARMSRRYVAAARCTVGSS